MQPPQPVFSRKFWNSEKLTNLIATIGENMSYRRSIGLSEVCVLVLDATEPMSRADLSAASFAIEEGRCVLIALNKIESVEDPRGVIRELNERLEESLSQVQGVPVVPLSLVPSAKPADQWRVGQALAPLADQGVLLIGSGASLLIRAAIA